MNTYLPIIDISPFLRGDSLSNEPTENEKTKTALEIETACRECGFFYVQGHGIKPSLQNELHSISTAFFALSEAEKNEISMDKGGPAWRGYFSLGTELTSGKADQKEGIYFGTELDGNDSRVKQGIPLHGKNLWPAQINSFKKTVSAYMQETTDLAQAVLRGIAMSLSLEENYFLEQYTQDPMVLFRIFHYPAINKPEGNKQEDREIWGVGEHTDYGLLTLLAQDQNGGLEVKSGGKWMSAPPIDNTFVCNIGDMLDKLTGGWYVSTPHRVKAQHQVNRLSFPLFLDPCFGAEIEPLPLINKSGADMQPRWDSQNLDDFNGPYGDYLLSKVAKVFPALIHELENKTN